MEIKTRPPYDFLPDRILSLRLEKGMTQVEFACALSIPRSKLAKIELGMQKCDVDLLFNVATLFDVSTDYLLGIK